MQYPNLGYGKEIKKLISTIVMFLLLLTSSNIQLCFAQTKLDTVKHQLPYYHQFQFAGFYAAQAKGFYKEKGLFVKISEAKIDKLTIQEVTDGGADFGVMGTSLIRARLEGEPVVVLKAIFQHSPFVIITLKKNNIRTPSDLVGKKLMIGSSYSDPRIMTMVKNEGIDVNKIIFVRQSWNYDDIISGKVDAATDYITDQPYYIKQHGLEPYSLKPVDYGVNFYEDLLFTSENEIKKNPEGVNAFASASMKGWKYAFENVDEIVTAILHLKTDRPQKLTKEMLLNEAEVMRDYVLPDLINIGQINKYRFETIEKAYKELDASHKDISLDGFLYKPDVDKQSNHNTLIIFLIILGIGILISLFIVNQLRRIVRKRTFDLEQSELKNSAILNAIPDLMFRISKDGIYLDYKDPQKDQLTVPEKDVVGKSLNDLLPEDLAKNIDDSIHKTLETRALQIFEYKLMHKDRISDFEARFMPVGDEEVLVIARDVTERKKEIESLKISEEKFSKAFNLSPNPMAITSLSDGKIIDINSSYEKISGYSKKDCLGKKTSEINIWENYEDRDKFTSELRKNKRVNNFEANFRVKNGNIVICIISAEIITIDGKECILGTYRDITEIRLKEKLLKESEEKYRKLFESADDAIFIMDGTKFIDCNPKTLEIFKCKREEIINKTPMDFSPEYQADNLLTEQKAVDKITKCLNGNPQFFEWKHIKKDGSPFDAEVSLSKLEIANKQYLLAIVRDITKTKINNEIIKESEEKFSKIFKSSPNPIIITTMEEGIIINANNRLMEVAGYSMDEIRNKSIFDLNIWEISEEREAYIKSLKENGKVDKLETNFRKKNGEIFPVIISSELIEIHGEKFILGNFVDISKLKENEKNLKNALEELERLKRKLQNENIYLKEEIKFEHNFTSIITKNEAYKEVLKKIEQVAATDATVLILGETGTGKELLSRSIHNISDRSDNPLIKVNCATLPFNLIESELFGHEKGAFTGAIKEKVGKFELANGGTIFLDEVGELPLELQTKLLRVLQENEIERLGSSKTIKIDVRVIAATNRNLKKMVHEGKFREDLYFRLNVFPITTIPLRNRREDIPLLLNYFVKEYNTKFGKDVTKIPQATLDKLNEYSWPGNVREFQNVIERALILSNSETLILDKLETSNSVQNENIKKPTTLKEIEKEQIIAALKTSNGKIEGESGAASILGIPPSTLRDKIKKYKLNKPS